jgi:hypothetical protein
LRNGWHEFINVDYELFHGIVLVQTDEEKGWREEWMSHGFYPSIRVVPKLGTKGLEAIWGREKNHKWSWSVHLLTDQSVDLRYLAFFDWADWSYSDSKDTRGVGCYRDYQYIRCRIVHSDAHRQLVGADMLLPALEVAVYYDV